MLHRHGIDVVAFGGSPDDPNAAFLIRAFDDLADRARREEAFYGSNEWPSARAKRSSLASTPTSTRS